MLQQIGIFLSQNWLGTLIGAFGLTFAIYESKRSRGPKFAYQFIGQRILGSTRERLPGDLTVSFAGAPVKALSLTYIIVWNKGAAAVRNNDLSEHHPITFSFGENSRIFSAEVTKVSREANQVEIDFNQDGGDGLVVTFDFLDSNDGALISVWHDSLDTTPDCVGTIVGQRRGPVSYGRYIARTQNLDSPSRPSKSLEQFALIASPFLRRNLKIMPIGLIVIGILLAISPHVKPFLPQFFASGTVEPDASGWKLWMPTVFGGLYALMGFWFLSSVTPKFPKELLPDEFSPKREAKS